MVVAETTITPAGRQVPIPFELHYGADAIDQKHSYAVRATIRSGDQLLYTTNTAAPVITRGNPTQVPLMSVRQAERPPRRGPSSGARRGDSPISRAVRRCRASRPRWNFPNEVSVAGKGSCNRFFGTANVSGDSLTLSKMGATLMACVGPGMEQEGRYLKALGAARRYSLEADTLLIYTAGSDRPLRFTRLAP